MTSLTAELVSLLEGMNTPSKLTLASLDCCTELHRTYNDLIAYDIGSLITCSVFHLEISSFPAIYSAQRYQFSKQRQHALSGSYFSLSDYRQVVVL